MMEKSVKMSADSFLGMFATVKAGHDKGRMYLVIKDEGDFVYLVNGKNRGLDNPRKKRKKHIQIIKKRDETLTEKLISGSTIYNEEIRLAVRSCEQLSTMRAESEKGFEEVTHVKG